MDEKGEFRAFVMEVKIETFKNFEDKILYCNL